MEYKKIVFHSFHTMAWIRENVINSTKLRSFLTWSSIFVYSMRYFSWSIATTQANERRHEVLLVNCFDLRISAYKPAVSALLNPDFVYFWSWLNSGFRPFWIFSIWDFEQFWIFPFGILSISGSCPFWILSNSGFCPFGIMPNLEFSLFGIFSTSGFCPFGILSNSRFCLIWDFVRKRVSRYYIF